MLYPDPQKNRITRQVLPDAVFQADPYRPYLPSSPYVTPAAVGHPDRMPEQHLWGPRDYFKSDFYTHHRTLCQRDWLPRLPQRLVDPPLH